MGGLGLLGLTSSVAGYLQEGATNDVLFMGGMFGLASAVLAVVYLSTNVTFRCYSSGVRLTTTFRDRRIRFGDVGQFSYEAIRNYLNGVYTGTVVTLKFWAQRAAGGARIEYLTTLKGGDEELDRMREHLSRLMAGPMADRLRAGGVVPWVGRAKFHPAGLEVPGRRPFGLGKPRGFTYRSVWWEIRDGTFSLYVRPETKPVFRSPVKAVNFFPGLALLDRLKSEAVAG